MSMPADQFETVDELSPGLGAGSRSRGGVSCELLRLMPAVLKRGEVHIWVLATACTGATVGAFEEILAPDERDRANRLIDPDHRASFVLARGVLKCILGGYLGASPSIVRFSYSPHGKPSLASPGSLDFNLAHSGKYAAIAISSDRGVGIDLECVQPIPAVEPIAARFFCPAEAEAFASLAPQMRSSAFFRCWARKEAYIKGLGRGLSKSLESFQVDSFSNPAQMHSVYDPEGESDACWTVKDLSLIPGYAAALAVPFQLGSYSIFSIDDLKSPYRITYHCARRAAVQGFMQHGTTWTTQ